MLSRCAVWLCLQLVLSVWPEASPHGRRINLHLISDVPISTLIIAPTTDRPTDRLQLCGVLLCVVVLLVVRTLLRA